jgi:release factor glutamine methyltransferase
MNEQIDHITNQLLDIYPKDEAHALAWWVVEESTGLSRNEILLGCKDTKNIPNLQAIIERLRHFEPIQYIFGHTLWSGMDLLVTPDTLIPRPETAELVEQIIRSFQGIKTAKEPLKLLDIGTGTGCIAIALKRAFPHWKITAIDVSQKALEIARKNATKNNAQIHFIKCDILSDEINCLGTFDIIVSNPPYICENEKSEMRANVLNYEPSTALFVPNDDPLLFYRRIASMGLCKHLFFEINEHYATEMYELLKQKGFINIQLTNDIYGKARIIQGRLSS